MDIFKKIILLIFSLLFVLAGINNWKYPSIFWYLRETQFGEFLNRIVMVIIGILLLVICFS